MVVYLINGLVILFFSIVATIERQRYYLLASFFFIFVFQAVRYGYGNDYWSYLEIYKEINTKNFSSDETRIEIGWILLNKIFSSIGFYTLIASVSFFLSYAYFKFIDFFVSSKYYLFSIFIFYFDSNILLLQITAIRQSVAIALFMLSLIQYYKKKYLITFLMLVVASLFHSSALIIIPFFLYFHFFKKPFSDLRKILYLLGFLSFFLLVESLKDIITLLNLYLLNDRYYEYTVGDDVNPANIVNLVYYTILLSFLIIYMPVENNKFNLLFHFLILGIFILPLAQAIPLIARLSYYFLPISVVIFPLVYENIRIKSFKYFFLCSTILVIAIRLYSFFNSETYSSSFMNYNTIFSLLL